VNNEIFITSIVEIKVLKKVLLSLRNLDENRLKARVIKAIFIDIGKMLIIAKMIFKIVRKIPTKEIK